MYLKRYHDLRVSTLGVWRILKRLEMNRLQAPPALPPPRRPLQVDRWGGQDLNLRPTDYESAALTD